MILLTAIASRYKRPSLKLPYPSSEFLTLSHHGQTGKQPGGVVRLHAGWLPALGKNGSAGWFSTRSVPSYFGHLIAAISSLDALTGSVPGRSVPFGTSQ